MPEAAATVAASFLPSIDVTSRPLSHPQDILFAGERSLPSLPAVDHYAGSEKLIAKALRLQQQLGPVFDLTCDCEDGTRAGADRQHAEMIARLIASEENRFCRVGARIHDVTHPAWRQEVEILVGETGARLAYLTLPKVRGGDDVRTQLAEVQRVCRVAGVLRPIPVHVLIETERALREAWDIAAIPEVECLDFGLMDFVSDHHGAIPASAMVSPGQFEHPLIVRAKCQIAAAALANGALPAHNVTTELRDVDLIRRDAQRARQEFGFLRMWSIHPNQILPIVEAMRPDFSEVEAAVEILIAAQDCDWGPIQHAGRLHDRASYRYYWELLQRARLTGMVIPAAVADRFFA